MANKDIINIGIDKYDLQEEWMEKIGSKYLDLDTMNKNKTGLFGYLNEVMATEVRNSIAHRNFLIDETFLNTASLRKSIYNKAKSYNYDIPLARPSSLNITYSMKAEDILKYGTKERELDKDRKETGNFIFKLSKDNIFYLGGFSFMLEYDVEIKATRVDKSNSNIYNPDNYSYTARYDFTSNLNSFSNLSSSQKPYIKTWIEKTERASLISLFLRIFQVEKEVRIEENFSSDISDNLLFTEPFKNQLAKFEVKYIHNEKAQYIPGYFNDTFSPRDDKFFFYSFNNNSLNLTFSALPNSFRPALNSVLEIEMYTTMGSRGNFNFDGDIIMKFADKRLQGRIEYFVFKDSNPLGGKDSPSMKEIKQHLIHEFLTRENLVTEFDLNSFFRQIIKDEVVNESDILFIKKRDDVIKRIYGVYLLLKDKTGLVIPTNTIDLEFPCDIDKDIFIPAGTKLVYTSQNYVKYYEELMSQLDLDIYYFHGDEYVEYNDITKELLPKDEKIYDYGEYTIFDPKTMDINTFDIVYRLPFSLVYKRKPFQRLLLVQDTIDDKVLYNYGYVNSHINSEFLMNDLEIRRNSINFNDDKDAKTNEIELSLSIDTTYPVEDIYNLETLKDKGNLKIRGIFKGKSGIPTGYIDFKLNDTQKLIYKAKLQTDNKYNEDNKLNLKNCVYNINGGKVFDNFPVKEEVDLDLYFLIDSNTSNYSKFPVMKKMPDTKGYEVAVVMENHKQLGMFRILNPVSAPVLQYKYKANTIDEYDGFKCLNIPVVGAKYLNNYEIYKEFFSIFDIYYDILVDNFNRLENSTKLDLKFFNTFGSSKHFTTDTTNLSLELNIKLHDNYSNDLDYKIKKFIIDFIEYINQRKNKTFAISNLLRSLEREFPDIDYIEFISLNGTNQQTVLFDYPEINQLNRKQLINYIPEYLNVGINEESYTGKLEDFDVDIKINYKNI